jgi:hypothetical protein
MPDARRGRRSTYLNGKSTPLQADDEREGEWPRERLIRMNERFVAPRARDRDRQRKRQRVVDPTSRMR